MRLHGATPPRSAFSTNKAVGKASVVVLGKDWGTGGERGTSLRGTMRRWSDCSLYSLNQTVPSPPPSYVLMVSTIIEIWQEVSFTEGMIS